MKKDELFTLCELQDVGEFIGLGVRTLKERWLPNENKIRQYNGIQVITFLDKEGIDEETLFKIVKFYNAITNDKETINKIFKNVLDKGLDDG